MMGRKSEEKVVERAKMDRRESGGNGEKRSFGWRSKVVGELQ